MAELTEKQKRFADYFVESGNATEAAVKAGYSEKYAGQNADKLLKNTKIRMYIDKLLESKDNERIASQDEVLEFLTNVMRGKVTERVPILVGGGMQELVSNVPAVQVREKAAELLGKRYMLWTDKVEHSGDLNIKVGLPEGMMANGDG